MFLCLRNIELYRSKIISLSIKKAEDSLVEVSSIIKLYMQESSNKDPDLIMPDSITDLLDIFFKIHKNTVKVEKKDQKISVLSICGNDHYKMALIDYNGQQLTVKSGDSFDYYVITEITEDSIFIEDKNGTKIKIKLLI